MCDDATAMNHSAVPAKGALSRRNFAVLGTAAAVAACADPVSAPRSALRERMVSIATSDGTADCFFVHPARGKHPAVLLWPDIGGLREAFMAMARQLAASGYAVLVANQYYRSAKAPVLSSFAEWRTEAGRAKLAPMIAAVTQEATMRDAAAFAGFLDAQPQVDKRRKIGTQGYCMGGPHAIRSAAAVPARIGAVASFHGAGIATDAPDSPHLLVARSRATYLLAVARNDDVRDPAEKTRFTTAASAAGLTAEAVVYPADHGWCVPDSPVYDKAQAELAWEQLLGLYMSL